MNKPLRWGVLGILVILVLGLIARNGYVLDSQKLDPTINKTAARNAESPDDSVHLGEEADVLGRPWGRT